MVVEGNFPENKNGQNDSSEPKEGTSQGEQHDLAALTNNTTTISTDKPINQQTDDKITAETNPPEVENHSSEILDDSPASPPENSFAQIQGEVQTILGFNPDLPALLPGRTPPLSPEDEERINKYRKFQKVDGAAYRRVNQFLRKHTYVTAREWAIARLCADFTTRGGAEMTFIGENLPDLVPPFMTDTYSPQAVNQARSSFKRKVRKSGGHLFLRRTLRVLYRR